MDDRDVPADFPQELLQAVPGAQPKVLAYRTSDGRYIDQSVGERAERWALCVNLREQLVDYVMKNRQGAAARWQYLEQVCAAVEGKRSEWGLSIAEVQWVCKELRAHFQR